MEKRELETLKRLVCKMGDLGSEATSSPVIWAYKYCGALLADEINAIKKESARVASDAPVGSTPDKYTQKLIKEFAIFAMASQLYHALQKFPGDSYSIENIQEIITELTDFDKEKLCQTK